MSSLKRYRHVHIYISPLRSHEPTLLQEFALILILGSKTKLLPGLGWGSSPRRTLQTEVVPHTPAPLSCCHTVTPFSYVPQILLQKYIFFLVGIFSPFFKPWSKNLLIGDILPVSPGCPY